MTELIINHIESNQTPGFINDQIDMKNWTIEYDGVWGYDCDFNPQHETISLFATLSDKNGMIVCQKPIYKTK